MFKLGIFMMMQGGGSRDLNKPPPCLLSSCDVRNRGPGRITELVYVVFVYLVK